MASNYRKLGEYIREVDRRNIENGHDNLLGLSVTKRFIPSIANTVGTDFRKYKVVKKGQFAYIPDTSRRGNKIAIALLKDWDSGLVSNVYTVFDVIGEGLLPEYLDLWFRRPEFDRYARFKSHGSVREVFDWEQLCDVSLPVPTLFEQQRIVDSFDAIEQRISALRRLNDKLAASAEAIFSDSILETEREMVPLTQLATIGAGGDKPTVCVDAPTEECCIPVYSNGVENAGLYGYTDKAKVKAGSTTISARGTIGFICLRTCDYVPIVRLISVTPKQGVSSFYLYLYLRTLNIEGVGSTQQQLTAPMVKGYEIPSASADEMAAFDEKVKPLFDFIGQAYSEIALLQKLKRNMQKGISGTVE